MLYHITIGQTAILYMSMSQKLVELLHLSYNFWCIVRSVKLLFRKSFVFDDTDAIVAVWLSEILASLPCGVEHGVWKSSIKNQNNHNVRQATPKQKNYLYIHEVCSHYYQTRVNALNLTERFIYVIYIQYEFCFYTFWSDTIFTQN